LSITAAPGSLYICAVSRSMSSLSTIVTDEYSPRKCTYWASSPNHSFRTAE
jgi:hypothetical protein